jgi:hypothetical protein
MNSFTANDPEAQDLLALARLGGDSSLGLAAAWPGSPRPSPALGKHCQVR